MTSLIAAKDAISILERDDNQPVKDFLSDFNFVYTRYDIVRSEKGQIKNFLYESTNGAWEELSGKKAEEVIGLSFKKYSKFNANFEEWVSQTHKSVTTNKPVIFDQYITSNSAYYQVRLKYLPSDQIIVTYTDITYLSETEIQLRESNRNFEALFENTQTAVIQSKLVRNTKTNLDRLKIVKANQASGHLLNCKEIQKGNFLDGCASGKYLQEVFFRKKANSKESSQPFTFYHEPILKHLRVAHYQTGDDEIVLSILDVTEEVQKSAAVDLARKKYEDLLQNLEQPFVHLELELNKDGQPKDLKYQTINKAYEDVFGHLEAKIIGKSFKTVIKDKALQKWTLEVMSKTALEGVKQTKTQFTADLTKSLKYNIFQPQPGHVAFTVEDITEMMQSETTLKAANERLSMAINLNKLAVSELNMVENRAINYNQNWVDLYDLNPEQALSEFQLRVHEEDRKDTERALLEYIKQGKHEFEYVFRYWNKTETEFKWIHSNSKIIEWSDDGSPIKLLSICQDITKLRENQIDLRMVNQRLQRASELNNLSISELNLRTGETDWHNENWLKLYGIDPENTLDEFENRIHRDDLQAVGREVLSLTKDQKKSYRLIYRYWNKDKTAFKWIQSDNKVIKWSEDSAPLKILTAARDISYLKQTEAKHKHANERLNMALDLNKVAIWEWNVETDRIESYTENWEVLYGLHTGNISEHFRKVVHPEDLHLIINDNVRLYKGEIETSELEFRVINREDKQEKWIRNVSKVLNKDKNEKTLTILGYSMDITSHKLHEINEIKSNNRLKIAINNNKTAIYEWNIQTGSTISKNEYWNTLFDFDPKIEPLNQFKNRLFEEDKHDLNKRLKEIKSGVMLQFDFIYRIWNKDLTDYKWISESSRVTEFNNSGEPKILLVAATDITKQKQQEENERRANDRLNIALISNKTAVYEWDIQEDKILYHSHYWNELYGYDKSRALIPQFMDRIHEEDRERMIHVITESEASDDTNFQYKYRLWNEDRTAYKWISNNSRVIEYDRKGNPKVLLGAATDITTEKQKEIEVKDISRELTRAQSIARVGSWQLDLITEEIKWSLEVYKLLGFDPKLGVPPQEEQQSAFAPLQWEELVTNFELAVSKGNSIDLILELAESRRPVQWVQILGKIITDDKGNIIGIRGTTQDITKQKNIEDQLRKEMKFNASITENSYPALYIYDYRSRKYTYANKGFEVILGWQKSEILYMPVEEHRFLIHQGDFQKYDDHTGTLQETKTEQSIQFRLKHKTGYWMQCLVTEVPYEYGPHGEVNSVLGSVADVTDIVKAYDRLEKEKQFRDSISESTTSGIYIYDIKKGKNLYSNKGTAQILGFEKEELQHMNSEQFTARFHPEDVVRINQHIKDLLSKKKPKPIIYRFKHKLGHYITCYSLDSPYETDENGKVTSYIGTFVDISEMQHAQEELIKAKNVAEKANRQKDLFLANMSHEIRTPMNAVLGFSKLLKKEGLAPQKRESYIYQIENNSHQLMELIDDILNITQIENGQIKFIHTLLSLDRVIEDILEAQRVNIDKKKEDSELELLFAPSQDLWLEIDKIRLSQIINNLLTNAIKYSEKGTIEIGYYIDEDRLKIYVKDEGKGIKKADQKGIFERFAQSDEKLNTQTGGIGLGLSIARSLTNLLGGTLRLDSKYQKGSTFTILLPLEYCQDFEHKQSQNGTNAKSIKLKEQIAGKTIIVADDNEAVRFYYEEILSDYEINLYMAENGVEAVKLVKQFPEVDLVLMDIRMPKMDGVEALQEIRKFNPGIVVVAQSAFAMDEQIDEFRKEGFFDYITKPLQDEDILEIIAKST